MTTVVIEVTGQLREEQNLLTVHIESGLYYVADKQGKGYENSPDQLLHKRHWLRKPQFQFTWDWCCRLINVGIYKPVRMEWADAPCRVDPLVPLVELSPDLCRGSVRARLFVEGLNEEACRGRMTVELVEAGVSASAEVEIKPGYHPCEVTAEIDHPDLWWPAGHGPQNRYTLRVTLSVDGEEMAVRTVRVGFRRVRVVQDPHPEAGSYYFLEVNGEKIFAKGANWAPAELISAHRAARRQSSPGEELSDRGNLRQGGPEGKAAAKRAERDPVSKFVRMLRHCQWNAARGRIAPVGDAVHHPAARNS
jgi:beta-mannosidase